MLSRVLAHLAVSLLTVIAVLVKFVPQSAAQSAWVQADYVEGRLVSATEGVGSSDQLLVAAELKLKAKWKTYWRTPGDAGLPPELDWSGSQNLEHATLSYPAPLRFQLFGLQTYGYENRVVFPIRVKLKSAAATANLKLKLNVLVCSDVCVPQILNLVLSVPAGPATPSDAAHLIQRALNSVPTLSSTAGLSIVRAASVARSGQSELVLDVTSEQPLTALDIIPEIEPFVAFGAPTMSLASDGRSATARFAVAQPLPPGEQLAGRAITLTATDATRAVEFKTTIVDGGAAPASSQLATLAMMLVFAVLGGLILNLMPCVLPVLSVKLLSLVDARDSEVLAVRNKFLATAAGIVTSLLLIAGVLIAVQSAGHAVGWGIQFQQPVFIAVMAVIVTAFACNLWGFFEVALPPALSNWAGGQGEPADTWVSNFITGMFVTVLATPCSAPFVGTAVGFALASGTMMTLAIFAALGIGLALPYLAVAFIPTLVRFLPRPGPWMITLRWILGFALLATAVWLVFVLARQIGWPLALLAALWLALFVAVLALRHYRPTHLSAGAGTAVAVGLALATATLPAFVGDGRSHRATMEAGPIAWTDFDEKQIRSLIAQGKTIFVDVTAEWCITCKANKQLVIYRQPVASKLQSNVVAMRADWTSPDPKITRFLARFGRYGIPMNVVFGPGQPQGLVLPEILTPDSVVEALEKAARRS